MGTGSADSAPPKLMARAAVKSLDWREGDPLAVEMLEARLKLLDAITFPTSTPVNERSLECAANEPAFWVAVDMPELKLSMVHAHAILDQMQFVTRWHCKKVAKQNWLWRRRRRRRRRRTGGNGKKG